MKLKRTIAFVLTLVLVVGLFPGQALATDETTPATQAATTPTETTETTVPETTQTETTEAATEAATEPATEAATEPATEPATEAATEPATEPEEDSGAVAPGFGEDFEDEDAKPLTKAALYKALLTSKSLFQMFELVNSSVDSFLSMEISHTYAIESHVEAIYKSYKKPSKDEAFAYEQMKDNILVLKTELGIAECICTDAEMHTPDCPLFKSTASKNHVRPVAYTTDSTVSSDGPKLDKRIVEDTAGNIAIQIDAWTEGKVVVTPTEIVMVVDQSGSMYQAVDGPDSWMTYSELVENGNKDGGQHEGYYVVVAENVRYNANNPTSWGTDGAPDSFDWNHAYDGSHKYAVALVRYNNDTKCWERSHQVRTTERQYNSLGVNPTYRAYDQLQWSTINPDKTTDMYGKEANPETGEGAKYFKSVYGATIDAYYTLLDAVKTIPNCSIAVAGFSSPENYGEQWTGLLKTDENFKAAGGSNYGGTGLFINGVFKHKSKLTPQDYKDALVPVSSEANINIISQSISNILSNYNETCTEDGFLLANEIFANSSQTNANRVVVLFTDGAPTVVSEMLPPDTENRPPRPTNYLDYAITAAYETKNTYNAKVYAFGNESIVDPYRLDLEYQSSNYPDAKISGGEYEKKGDGYYGIASSSEDIEKAFREIGEKIYNESLALNRNSEIRDTITPYFDIGGDYNGGSIIVQQIPNSGQLDANGNVIFNENSPTILFDEANNIKNVTLTKKENVTYKQPLSDGTEADRVGDQVIVSGYDYGANTVFPGEAKGYKLRLLIPIEPNDLFVGGNYAATNSPDSGIFPDSETDVPVGGKDNGFFEPPHTDVVVKDEEVMKAAIDARAGSTVLESITYQQILNVVTLRIDGIDTPLQMGQPNYGLEAWQLDYVNIDVKFYDTKLDSNGETAYEQKKDEQGQPVVGEDGKPVMVPIKDPNKEINAPTTQNPNGDSLEVRRDHAVWVEITVWPKFNHDGTVSTKPTTPTATGAVTLDVYYPTFVFKDVSLYYGEPLSKVTRTWKPDDGSEKMEATRYLRWYTNAEFLELENPVSDNSADGYSDLNIPSSYGRDGSVTVTEVPTVYFVVDPIDAMVPYTAKTGSVDTIFYQKYGQYMLKQEIQTNVKVFFQNQGDTWEYDPENTVENSQMRNAFFLHATGSGQKTVDPHTSGSKSNLELYWQPEFYINPKTCTLTIQKTGGIPGETYVFDIKTNAQVVVNPEADPDKLNVTTMADYTTVSITAGDDGKGSVTIYELPVGKFTITEDMPWSWRFNDPGSQTVTLEPDAAKDHATVTFENKNPVDNWLSGMSTVVQNVFGVAKS